ncbi:haloacid dehalogenase superfamily, subfamily IA, variant 1 with third motif having Dx(3-4)D or Dx(3-4)E [Bacillus sp. OV322]|nr:haloacid dehalogenase superfamily, subfamily IA, variant 1 with third motif having Dx(3-4)D or Dx(3-4)E [Bacillus sp. OV322]
MVKKQEFPIVFDLDGTLFDCRELTNQTFPLVIERLSEKYGEQLEIKCFQQYERFLGTVTEDIFAEILPNAGREIVNEAEHLLIEVEEELIPKAGKLYQGVEDTLAALKSQGYPLFIASNGSKEYVDFVLQDFRIHGFFDGVFSAGGQGTKTKSDLVAALIKNHGYTERGIMVGDRHSDMEAGTNSGLMTVGCTYGFGDEKEIGDADVKISAISELVDVVREIEEKQYEL